MCGRIGLPQLSWSQFVAWQRGELSWDEIIRDSEAKPAAYGMDIRPTQNVEITFAGGNDLVSTAARWWLVPHWHKGDLKDWKATTFNAQIETASEKPSFRTAWKTGRCAVLATGYNEWTGEKGSKQRHWITTDTNEPYMAFAGLHTQLRDGTRTCTILTRKALPQIAHLHHRSPVILSADSFAAWLKGEMDDEIAQNELGTEWNGRLKYSE